jgi:UDP-2,4-diacetamido-2,4,6-trideoxy-beta-L-altropyranose hydrolase
MNLALRGILPQDASILLAWRNDPETRRNSINTGEISWKEHVRWFEEVMHHHHEQISIAELDSIPVGVIRFSWNEHNNSCDVSFTVASEYRGRGVGLRMVQQAIEGLRSTRILARVKSSNFASRRIFERLGFIVIDTQGELLFYARDV